MSGHLKIDATRLGELAHSRNWSDQQINNAKRIIDGGMGTTYGFKEYEETTLGEPEDGGMEGFGWVYYLYNERVEELESII
jgi:hypothetical protein